MVQPSEPSPIYINKSISIARNVTESIKPFSLDQNQDITAQKLKQLLLNRISTIGSQSGDKANSKTRTEDVFSDAVCYNGLEDFENFKKFAGEKFLLDQIRGLRGNRPLALSTLLSDEGYNKQFDGILQDEVIVRKLLDNALISDIHFLNDEGGQEERISALSNILGNLNQTAKSATDVPLI